MKEDKYLKIRHHSTDVGFCTEIWQTEMLSEDHLYLGRSTESDRTWHILNDAPYGFCEMGDRVGKHVVLIICDENWNEIGRDGNDFERFPERFCLITKS